MTSYLAYVLCAFAVVLQILTLIIVVRAVLSWFPNVRGSAAVEILDRLSEPVIAPLRRIVPPLGMIDITPMVALLLLFVIRRVIDSVVRCPF